MAWIIVHGSLGSGLVQESWHTEEAVVTYACDLINRGKGIRSICEEGAEEPKYEFDELLGERPFLSKFIGHGQAARSGISDLVRKPSEHQLHRRHLSRPGTAVQDHC